MTNPRTWLWIVAAWLAMFLVLGLVCIGQTGRIYCYGSPYCTNYEFQHSPDGSNWTVIQSSPSTNCVIRMTNISFNGMWITIGTNMGWVTTPADYYRVRFDIDTSIPWSMQVRPWPMSTNVGITTVIPQVGPNGQLQLVLPADYVNALWQSNIVSERVFISKTP